jgi:hypothetical protein
MAETPLDYLMDGTYTVEYYTQRLNEKRDTGRLLWIFQFPTGRPYQFITLTLVALNLLDFIVGGSYFILPAIAILICLSFYFKFKLREDLIDRCFCDEAMMDYEAKKFDEEDIDDEDRIGIFRYNYAMKGLRLSIIQNLKCYYKEVLIITAIAFGVNLILLFFR